MAEALQSTDAGVQEGTLTMIYKITEDLPQQMTSPVPTGATSAQPANMLMPHVASLLSAASSADVRFHALRTFNMLATLMPEWLQQNVEGYVSGLLALANQEKDSRILKVVPPAPSPLLTSSTSGGSCLVFSLALGCFTVQSHRQSWLLCVLELTRFFLASMFVCG
jgi:hypothetical protein